MLGRHLLVLGGTLALLATSESIARADSAVCSAQSEAGQRAKAAGKFRDARKSFLECSSAECPSIVRTDCTQWHSEIVAAMPSVTIDARSESGKDVIEVAVDVDEERIAKQLEGRALDVDPGVHVFRFTSPGYETIEQKIVVKEAVKSRVVAIRFVEKKAPATTTSDGSPDYSPRRPPAQPEREHTVWPWAVVAAGGTLMLVGSVFAVRTLTSACADDDPSTACTPSVREGASDEAWIATAFLTTGILAAIGGLAWHFLE